MKLQTYILAFLLLAPFSTVVAQRIENVDFRVVNEKEIWVTYDIVDALNSETFDVSMEVSLDGGKTYTIVPKSVSGDVGVGVYGGKGKKIIWNVLADTKEYYAEQTTIKLSAKVNVQKGLYLFYGLGVGFIRFIETNWEEYRPPNWYGEPTGYNAKNEERIKISVTGTFGALLFLPAIGYRFTKEFAIEFRLILNASGGSRPIKDGGLLVDLKYYLTHKFFLKGGTGIGNNQYEVNYQNIANKLPFSFSAGWLDYSNENWFYVYEIGLFGMNGSQSVSVNIVLGYDF